MSGWLKLHRKLLVSNMYKSLNSKQRDVLFSCLMLANHSVNEWMFGGKIFKCMPGQFITSLDSIAKNCGSDVKVQSVRTALLKLEKWHFLTSEATKTGRLITICKWDIYQQDEIPTNKDFNKGLTKSQQGANKDLTTNNNVKKDKEEKEPPKPPILKPDNEIAEKLRSFDSKILEICRWFKNKLGNEAAKRITPKNKLAWCETLEKCNRIDGFSFDRIFEIVKFIKEDSFWNSNFLTLNKLREKKSGEDLTFIFRWDAKMKAPKVPVKETYEQTVSRTVINKHQSF